jgi:hypothetical protein
MKYYDVFAESGHHSAFLTTFAFSAQAFEDIVLPKLRGAGCRNIAVLADRSMLNLNLAEFGAPRYAGALYHVAKVGVGGAFHPKMALLIGANQGRLLIGSANLTALGLAGNRELVADVHYTSEYPQHGHIFREAVQYLMRHIPGEDPWFQGALARAIRQAPWLRDLLESENAASPSDLRLLGDFPENPILDQIESAIAGDTIERLVVLSPYWDAQLEGLSRLRSTLGEPVVDVLIDPDQAQFPAESLPGDGVELFGLKKDNSGRFVHAKLFVALGETWDHVISGSMNCSLPALMGPAVSRGNAELGLYKRVDRGAALQALNLADYRDLPIKPSEMPPRVAANETSDASSAPDGGTFTINGERIYWTPPSNVPFEPEELQLFDRDGSELQPPLSMPPAGARSWALPDLGARPRTARIRFEDTWSAPTIIVDLDELALRTMPLHRGKKRRIVDYLDETEFEDPELLQVINELEALDLEEQSSRPERVISLPGAAKGEDGAQEHWLLSYEDFVRARERARLADDFQAARRIGARYDSAADLVSQCLNRLIGLVSRNLSSDEEEDLRRQSEIDLRGSEPTASEDQEAPEPDHRAQPAEQQTVRQQAKATAKKIDDAIRAFEQRTKAMANQRISTTELVRLRSLLQIVLAYAEPADRQRNERTVLPITAESGDWPRLLGRLLMQHFRTMRALQMLDVEPDENEHQRVMEYLAVVHFSAKMALAGARQSGPKNSLIAPLEKLAADVEAQVRTVVTLQKRDADKTDEITIRLNDRFATKLKLPQVLGLCAFAKQC